VRKGRPTIEEEERTSKQVEKLVPEGPEGVRFRDLALRARDLDISKPTLWRHLQKLTTKAAIIHQGKWYRKNPLLEYQMKESDLFPVVIHESDNTIQRGGPFAVQGSMIIYSIEVVRDKVTGKQLFSGQGNKIRQQESGELKWTSDNLRFALDSGFQRLILDCLSIMYSVHGCSKADTARAVVKLRLEREIQPMLAEFLSTLWDHRDMVNMTDLDGLELKYTVRYKWKPKTPT
jgi:hypothetical protein